MVANNYQVIIYTEHCEDEAGVVAHRLGTLSGQPEAVFLEELLSGTVIFQRNLSYADALKHKEDLGNEGIPAEIRAVMGEWDEKKSVASEGLASRKSTSLLDEADVLWAESGGVQDEGTKSQSSGGWDALFPDLSGDVDKAAVSRASNSLPKPAKKSAVSGPTISSWQPAMDTQEGVVASVPVAKKQKAQDNTATRVEKLVERRSESLENTDRIDEIKRSRVFAGTVLSDAVAVRDETRGRYAPSGFDPRPAHVPVVAAIFSGIAPGAGQIYNGQEATALYYGVRFWWIRPWILSVRQAYDYGIRVRDYHEPRPDEASFKRALRYAAGWYLVVCVVVGLLVFGANAMWDGRVEPEHPAMQVAVGDVVERAVNDIQFARMTSNTAVNRFLDEQNKLKQEFTMSGEERAQRLYVIGYSYCVGRQYSLCEATMRRVTSLGVGNRDAYRLQAWASMQIKEGGRTAMPQISEVPTLLELDLFQENDPDRDIVQPALDWMLHEQGFNNAVNEDVDEGSKTGDADRVMMPDK